MALTKVTNSMIVGAPANVFDFLPAAQIAFIQANNAAAQDSAVVTAAFTSAMASNKNVYAPAGVYLLSGLRITNGVHLIGAGKSATYFQQAAAGTPVIDCTSDATVGQLSGLRLAEFSILGHVSASVAAVKIYATGIFAIWRSSFDFGAFNTYQAASIEGPAANNVFYCDFKIQSETTTGDAIKLDGGVYNTFDLFLTNCATYAIYGFDGFNCTFVRCVADGCILLSGQNTLMLNPTVEELSASIPPTPVAITLGGFNQKLINPTIILSAANSAKVTHAFAPFSGTSFENPRILTTTALANPFYPTVQAWTLIGPGTNGCANKMEAVYDCSSDTTDLRKVARSGNLSSFCDASWIQAGKTTQYVSLSAGVSINYTIKSVTDLMLFDQAGTTTLINATVGYAGFVPDHGQSLTVYAKAAITTIGWGIATTDVSLLPTAMTAGQTIRYAYDSGTNKWWPA